MTLTEKQFYTYLWLREDGSPYYIGKGHGKRAFTSSSHAVRKPRQRERTILLYARTEREALDREVELIARFGRKDSGTGCLRNMTDGGEGTSGHTCTAEAKARISTAKKGRPLSEEQKRKLSTIMAGRCPSLKAIEASALNRRGKRLSENHRESLCRAWKRRAPFSNETRAKMRASITEWWRTRKAMA